MAKKINEKSVKKFLKSYDMDPVQIEIAHGDAKIEMAVNKLVDAKTLFSMVEMATESVFNKGRYNPAMESAAKWASILCHVANFTTDLEDDQFMQLCYCQKIRDAILGVWNKEQHDDFQRYVAEMVAYRRDEIISTQKAQLERLSAQLESASSYLVSITDAFKNVDPASLVAAIERMSGMNELDLGNAIIDIQDIRKADRE